MILGLDVHKVRGKRHNGDAVEFGMEDLGLVGKSHQTRITRDGRDPFIITTSTKSTITREESDIRQVVGFFGLKRNTLEVEVDGEWQPMEPEPVK